MPRFMYALGYSGATSTARSQAASAFAASPSDW
jgi:hypothetical protein